MKKSKHQPQSVCHLNQITQRLHRLLPAGLLMLLAVNSNAASGDWTNNAASVWSAATNWSSNPTVPGTAAGDSVGLTFDITANRTVTMDTTSRTVGTLNIGDPTTGYFAYTLAASGGATLTFNNGGIGALLAKPMAANTALDVISTPITLADNLTINTAVTGTGNSGNSLQFTGLMTESGGARTLTKNGVGGVYLNVGGLNNYSGGTIVNAGEIQFSSSLALGTGLITMNGGSLAARTAARTLTNSMTVGGDFTFNSANAGGNSLTLTGNVDLGNATRTITVASTANPSAFLSGNISGGNSSVGLIKAGASVLNISGANTFSGDTRIVAGGLQLRVSTGAPAGTSLALQNSTLDLATADTGTLSFQGSSGTVAATLGGLKGSRNLALLNTSSASVALTVGNNSQSTTYSGVLSGIASSFTKIGAGTLVLSGANTYDGVTTISGGSLQLGNGGDSGSLFATGAIQNDGNLTINRNNAMVQGVDFGGGSIVGVGSFTQAGSGTTTLNMANTYSGATTVSAGKLVVDSQQQSAGAVSVANGAALAITAISPSAQWQPASLSLGAGTGCTLEFNNVANAGTTTAPLNPASVTRNGTVTVHVKSISGAIAVGGSGYPLLGNMAGSTAGYTLGTQPPGVSGHLAVSGTTLTFVVDSVSDIWNAASPGGDWDVSVTANWAGNAANNSPANTFKNGDSVLFNDTVAGPQTITIAAAVTPGPVNVDNTATEYSITASGANNIGGTTALAKSGSGTLTLSGPNTYSGGTTLSSGRLNINDGGTSSANSAIGTGALTISGGTLGNTGSGDVTLLPNNPQAWNGNFGYDGTGFNLNLGTGAVTPNASRQINVSANTLKVGGAIGGGAISLTKTGNGILALAGANTFSGGLILNGGQLDINASSALGTGTLTIGDGTTIDNSSGGNVTLANNPQIWNGNFTFAGLANNLNLGTGPVSLTATRTVTVNGNTLTVGGVISGAVGLTKAGPGTLVLTGASTYGNNGAADTAHNGGTLAIGNDLALGSSRLNFADAVTIQSTDSTGRTLTNNLNFGSGAGGNTFFAGTGNLKFTGSANNGTAKTMTVNNPVTEFSGVLSGAMARTVAGTGVLILSGANTYSLGTIINPGATLQLGNGGGTGSLSTSGAIANDGTLRFNRTNAVVQGIDFSGTPITGIGSVVQNGSGTVTLNAANTYTGPTIVNNGALFITPAYQGGSDVIVGNGTSFGVSASSVSNSATVGTLTLGSGGVTTLDLSYGLTGNPTNAVLVANSIVISGSSSIRIGGSFVVGTFPILKYNSLSGTFNATVTGPRGVTATWSNDVVNKIIYVTISSVGNGVVWTGTNNVSPNLWDLNTTVNWLIGGTPTTYIENVPPGDAVTFNNIGSGLVLLSNTASPASVTISNTVNYTIQGTGGQINSSAGLTKVGAGSVTLNVPGNYSGNTVISNGPISIGANQTWANLSGNSAVDVSAGAPTITVNNSLNTTFAGSLNGALGLTKTGVGQFTLPGSNDFTGNLFVKAGGVTLSSGFLGLANFASIGQNGTDDGTLTVKETTIVSVNNDLNVGDVGASVGTLNIQDTASLTVSSFYIGSANAALSSASGTVNQTGGTVTQLNTAAGTFSIGGRVETTSAAGVGIYNLSAGTLTAAAGIRVGSAGPGTFNQSGGTVNANGDINIGRFGASIGTYNLDGGTLRAAHVLSSVGPNATFNFNGGVLIPTADNQLFVTNLAQVNVRNGGAVIDTAGLNVIISSTLQHSIIGGDNAIDGGLTKRGEGMLTLGDAFSSYTGPTFVAAGGLSVSPNSVSSLNTLTVSNSTLRLAVSGGAASVTAAGLKLAGTSALNVNYDQLFGAPLPALNISGGLTVSGTTTINLYGYGLTVGQFALVDYTGAALPNLSNFVLGALPYGVTASLVNNTANSSIDLLITGVSSLNWIPLVASDAFGSSSFNTGLNWSDFNAPTFNNGYYTRAFTVRSPADTLPYTFAGDILAIDEGGQLLLKGTGGQIITVNNLQLNGGLIVFGISTTDNLTETLAGNMMLQSGVTSSVGVNGSANAAETLTITAPISGGGNLRVGVGAGNVGTVVLAGNNTYTGTTTVSAGHLLVNGANGNSPVTVSSSGTLAGTGSLSGTVNVLAGGNLTPGIPARGALTAALGTLTAGNSTISGTVTMKIDRGAVPNSDKLIAPSVVVNAGATLTVNNLGSTALAAGDTFTLFSTPITGTFSTVNLPALPNSNLAWTNKLAINGTIAVVSTSTVNPSPTTITVTTTSSNMTLSWPLDHTGWTLQTQTNAITTGLSSTWFDVPGSTATNSVTVPLVPANPTVFYRLKL